MEEIENHPDFVAFLAKNFNEPQLAAIKWSAAHTLREVFPASQQNLAAAAAAAAAAGESISAVYPSDDDALAVPAAAAGGGEPFPFTLVQGPPGTGKTHTVWGILNILHLVLYQRYYQHMHVAITLGTARATVRLATSC